MKGKKRKGGSGKLHFKEAVESRGNRGRNRGREWVLNWKTPPVSSNCTRNGCTEESDRLHWEALFEIY